MSALALGIDLGGTKVEAALVDANGVVLAASRFRTPTGPLATSADLEAAVRSVIASSLAQLPADAELIGVGVGSAGPISVVDGDRKSVV